MWGRDLREGKREGCVGGGAKSRNGSGLECGCSLKANYYFFLIITRMHILMSQKRHDIRNALKVDCV